MSEQIKRTCAMCGKHEGIRLSTAGRWFCDPCVSVLPSACEEDEKDKIIEELKKALEDIAFGRVEGDYSDARQYAREALERSETHD